MTDETKAEVKALEYCVVALRQVQKAKDPRERLAAVRLEVEFTERIEKLRLADREPALAFQHGDAAEPAAVSR